MRGSVGLGIGGLIGGLVGAGVMYIALRPTPSHDTPAPPATVAAAPVDAGVAKAKHKHPTRRSGHAGGPLQNGDETGWGDTGGDDTVAAAPLVKLSAADRALEWRGDDISRPTQRVDMASSSEARSLDDGEIQAAISSQSGPAQQCLLQSATNTDLKGTITVKLVVDGNGRVTRSQIQAFRYLFEHGLLGCMQRAVANMKFPATGLATLVTMPVYLT